jgi:hypothetical protein
MEPDELKRRFGRKRLGKQIPGQRLFPTSDLRFFKYGKLEQVYPMEFLFVYYFGGFSGTPFQRPPEGFAWIKSTGLYPHFWQVQKQDLDGNYGELEENR